MHMRPPKLNLGPRPKKILLRVGTGLLVVYVAGFGVIWWSMHQPPEKFGRVMMHLPGPVPFLLYPFETLWLRARAGNLNAGDRAPDHTSELQSRVDISYA